MQQSYCHRQGKLRSRWSWFASVIAYVILPSSRALRSHWWSCWFAAIVASVVSWDEINLPRILYLWHHWILCSRLRYSTLYHYEWDLPTSVVKLYWSTSFIFSRSSTLSSICYQSCIQRHHFLSTLSGSSFEGTHFYPTRCTFDGSLTPEFFHGLNKRSIKSSNLIPCLIEHADNENQAQGKTGEEKV